MPGLLPTDTQTIRIPKVYGYGSLPGGAFIAMEALNIRGRADQAEFGRRIAMMHLATPKVCVTAAQNPALSVWQPHVEMPSSNLLVETHAAAQGS
jgi:fructosamine-3-kinase